MALARGKGKKKMSSSLWSTETLKLARTKVVTDALDEARAGHRPNRHKLEVVPSSEGSLTDDDHVSESDGNDSGDGAADKAEHDFEVDSYLFIYHSSTDYISFSYRRTPLLP